MRYIPRGQTVADKFAETFGQTANAAFGAYTQQSANTQAAEKEKKQMMMENEAAKNQGIDLAGFNDPELRKILTSKRLEGQNENQKSLNKAKGEQVDTTIAQKAYDSMIDILNGGYIGRGSNFIGAFGGKTAEDASQFTSLNGALEALLVEMVSKGRLSDTRFNYIKNDLLPTSSDSQSTIKGKLTGLGHILGLDMSKLTGKKSEASNKSNENIKTEPTKEKPPLTSFMR